MPTVSRTLTVLMLALLSGSAVQAATVTGTVKGPDGTAFRGAFVQAQNGATKIMVSVLTASRIFPPVPIACKFAHPVTAPTRVTA